MKKWWGLELKHQNHELEVEKENGEKEI